MSAEGRVACLSAAAAQPVCLAASLKRQCKKVVYLGVFPLPPFIFKSIVP